MNLKMRMCKLEYPMNNMKQFSLCEYLKNPNRKVMLALDSIILLQLKSNGRNKIKS